MAIQYPRCGQTEREREREMIKAANGKRSISFQAMARTPHPSIHLVRSFFVYGESTHTQNELATFLVCHHICYCYTQTRINTKSRFPLPAAAAAAVSQSSNSRGHLDFTALSSSRLAIDPPSYLCVSVYLSQIAGKVISIRIEFRWFPVVYFCVKRKLVWKHPRIESIDHGGVSENSSNWLEFANSVFAPPNDRRAGRECTLLWSMALVHQRKSSAAAVILRTAFGKVQKRRGGHPFAECPREAEEKGEIINLSFGSLDAFSFRAATTCGKATRAESIFLVRYHRWCSNRYQLECDDIFYPFLCYRSIPFGLESAKFVEVVINSSLFFSFLFFFLFVFLLLAPGFYIIDDAVGTCRSKTDAETALSQERARAKRKEKKEIQSSKEFWGGSILRRWVGGVGWRWEGLLWHDHLSSFQSFKVDSEDVTSELHVSTIHRRWAVTRVYGNYIGNLFFFFFFFILLLRRSCARNCRHCKLLAYIYRRSRFYL